MALPQQHIRIIAGTPIEAGERRLLPSVLVNTVEGESSEEGMFRFVKMRPISLVEEGPEGARWHSIPNATNEALSQIAAAGALVALVSIVLLGLIHLIRS